MGQNPPGFPCGANWLSRRAVLTGAGASLIAASTAQPLLMHFENFWSSKVFIGKANSYSERLDLLIRKGLKELGLSPVWAKGKTVLLKPNLIEPLEGASHVTTHPAVIWATAEVFRHWHAAEVLVAEGSGHHRDADLILERSGVGEIVNDLGIEFVDLNHDGVVKVDNSFRASSLPYIYVPASVKNADIVVSIAKMKTHHWAGVSLSMKNLFGILPGICYGWPKAILHEKGIDKCVVDLNSTVKTDLAIIDGIVAMEGDGPIMGTPRTVGVIVIGTNPTAVDATGTRIMGMEPSQIDYLVAASGRLGPISQERIEQRGESIADVAVGFRIPDDPVFSRFRSEGGGS